MRQLSLACIVEGQGEESALRVLIQRIFTERIPDCWPQVVPIRVNRARLPKAGELERAVHLAAKRASAILILLDADDDCPIELARSLKQRAAQARSDIDTAVVVANREYEAWFIAAARSLSLLSHNEALLEDPEQIRGAKAWVGRRLATGTYSPTIDQASLSARMSLEEACRAPSFNKLVRDLIALAQRPEA
jgi:hypothetical protein